MFNCGNCIIPEFLAYFMMIYFIASIYYFIVTRSYGTPYADELKKDKYEDLRKIQEKSTKERGKAFMIGFIIGLVLILIFRPFKECF